MSFLTKIFGSSNQRALKRMQVSVDQINALESEYQQLSDNDLSDLRVKLKESSKDTNFDLLAHAFAATREASVRTIGLRHFDAQMLGGIALSEGNIAEMKTGEGKTLVSTLPVFLNALTGKGVHVVTVNDYLAKRDSEWMGKIYKFLGLSVGCITNEMDDPERKKNLLQVLDIDEEWKLNCISEGQRKRVQLYLNLLKPIDFCLLDEITVNLDILVKYKLFNYLKKECNNNNTSGLEWNSTRNWRLCKNIFRGLYK